MQCCLSEKELPIFLESLQGLFTNLGEDPLVGTLTWAFTHHLFAASNCSLSWLLPNKGREC